MNKKTLLVAASLLLAGGTLGLAACSGSPAAESSVPSSSQTTEESTGESTGATTQASDEEVVPTRVKITQPDTLIVGTTVQIKDIVEFTPANANAFILESKDENVAKVEGNTSFTAVGSGKTTIAIKVQNGDKTKTLGTIRVTALSEEGIALQNFVDGISNQFALEGIWTEIKGKTVAEVTEDDLEKAEAGFADLVVNPNYVLDWTYGSYSGVTIEADGNTYGYELLDVDGKELPSEEYESLASELAKAESVKLTERVDANYVNLYFVIEDLLDVTAWTEDVTDEGDVFFFTEDHSLAASLLQNLYGMDVSSYTNGKAAIMFDADEQALLGEFVLDQTYRGTKYANFVDFKLVTGDAAKIDALETAVKEALPPAGLDVTPLVDAFAEYTDNFVVDWEIGIFDNTNYAPVEGYMEYNSVGTTLIDGDTAAYASINRDSEGQVDPEQVEFGGIFTDTTEGGVYNLDADEDGKLALGSKLTGSDEFKDPIAAREALNFCCSFDFTKDILEGACLSLDEETGVYTYNATFDSCVVSYLLASFCPFGYTDSSTGNPMFAEPENAKYIEGFILPLEDGGIKIGIFERVRLTEQLSGLQGIMANIHSAGEVTVDLGDDLQTLFFGEEPVEPQGSEEPAGSEE